MGEWDSDSIRDLPFHPRWLLVIAVFHRHRPSECELVVLREKLERVYEKNRKDEERKRSEHSCIMVNDFSVSWLTENHPYETVENCSRYYPSLPTHDKSIDLFDIENIVYRDKPSHTRGEVGRVRSPDAGPSVLDRLVLMMERDVASSMNSTRTCTQCSLSQ